MKTYINLFYSIIDQIDNWEKTSDFEKKVILSNFLDNDADTVFLMNYFDKYMLNLTNNTLNSYIKGVVNN